MARRCGAADPGNGTARQSIWRAIPVQVWRLGLQLLAVVTQLCEAASQLVPWAQLIVAS
ncbi:hypothetical protein [uncultured Roseicyclus sp.]|uniref:hypothetical protein n=1 Tax=uncultured Roseicyclus sp. TaxID=543072 RepID=UPI002635E5F4|nr:hypothetical protein [uncultured Roseicyclus sp.]